MKLKATRNYHSTPISPKLASNFIELGYGLQVEGMAAEMFFNRSFEPFYPYRVINKLWYDLYENENDLSSRYETDWRVFDWCHSAYEHNAWFAFPGVAGYQEIRDDSTFVINDSTSAHVHIELIKDDHHGACAMKVENRGDIDGGLAQDGEGEGIPGAPQEWKDGDQPVKEHFPGGKHGSVLLGHLTHEQAVKRPAEGGAQRQQVTFRGYLQPGSVKDYHRHAGQCQQSAENERKSHPDILQPIGKAPMEEPFIGQCQQSRE